MLISFQEHFMYKVSVTQGTSKLSGVVTHDLSGLCVIMEEVAYETGKIATGDSENAI
jgi:hypothetical protein